MKIIKTTIGIALISVAMITGCSTLTSLEASVTAWLNNPATQSEISTIAAWALNFATQYLAGLLAVTPNAAPVLPDINSPAVVAQEAAAVTKLQALYPDAPQVVLQTKVHDAFVAALAQKAAAQAR